MQPHFAFVLSLFFISASVTAQSWKQTAQEFKIEQDDNKGTLFTLQLPAESKINASFNFATYVTDKVSLSVSYLLDDEPHSIKDVKKMADADLIRYAKALTNTDIAGSDIKISNKKIASKVETINNIKTLLIQYDYIKKGQERGKVFLYLLPVRGTSLIYDNDHTIVVRLAFDYTRTPENANSTLYKEIIGTLRAND